LGVVPTAAPRAAHQVSAPIGACRTVGGEHELSAVRHRRHARSVTDWSPSHRRPHSALTRSPARP